MDIFDASADGLGELVEEMKARWGELVAADETTVVSKSFLEAIVVEDGQGNGRFPDPPWTDESDWGQVFCEADHLLDHFVTTETGPRWWGRRLSEYARFKYKVTDSSTVEVPDLVWTYATISTLLSWTD